MMTGLLGLRRLLSPQPENINIESNNITRKLLFFISLPLYLNKSSPG
jgi:hypothetical protein